MPDRQTSACLTAWSVMAFIGACTQEQARTPERADTALAQQAPLQPTTRAPRFARYPLPTYLPAGFTFLKEDVQPPDGFHGSVPFGGNIEQVALIYWGPPFPGPSEGMRYPLKFIATKAHGYRLGGTENHEGTPRLIRFPDGSQVTATYWNGMWAPPRVHDSTGRAVPPRNEPVWSREIFHALVYRWGDYTIGIRASHLNGASLDELLKVAASTSIPRLE